MTIQQNVSLLPYNTFGLDVQAANFAEITEPADITVALETGIRPILILGGGSNILFTHDVPGLVLHNKMQRIAVVRETEDEVHIQAEGGMVWHDLVLWAVAHDFGGLENLSLIPGTVGAAPVQNIGAYGVELKDTLVELSAIDLQTGENHIFTREQCAFAYRDSIFKRPENRGRFFISSVIFALTKGAHTIHISYGDIQRTLESNGVTVPTIADVSRAVVQIRSSKLPDPAVIGNCGSFFKNPETEHAVLEKIQATHPNVPHYDLPGERVKIPAGWLIEQAGWKGKRVGNTGSYEKQALVLVNYGGATGEEVKNLAYAIIESVEQRFGVRLEPEVNML